MHPFFSSFEGLIPLVGGVCATLLAYGLLPQNPKNAERLALWQKRFGPMMRVIGPLVVIYGLFLLVTPPVQNEDLIAQTIRELNAGPKMVDQATRFDRATAGPGKRIIIEETLMPLKAADIGEQAWQNFLPQLKQNIAGSRIGRLPESGITVVYRYFGNDGVLIHEVIFSPLDLNKN